MARGDNDWKSRARRLSDALNNSGTATYTRVSADNVTTNSGGGNASLGSHLDLGDNQKVRFGASDDLQIYHNGTASFIDDVGTGSLNIRATDHIFSDPVGNNKIIATTGGSVDLYHNASKKLATTSSGIDVTGTVDASDALFNGLIAGRGLIIDTATEGVTDNVAILNAQHSAGILSLKTGGTERARIDSSGNVLVGKTSGNSNAAGIELHSNDIIKVTRSGGATGYFNRQTNDGSILEFAKDGTTVGSIGVSGSDNIYFAGSAGSTKGIYINDGAVIPASSGGSVVDDAVDLGQSNYRWKGLHLSGTVNAANATLTGYLRGPANFVIDPAAHGDDTGTVVIAGNLQIDGTTTTINSTTVTVDDKNVQLATGSTNKAAANGAGITVDCGSDTDARITYTSTTDEWDFNRSIDINGGSGTGLKIHSGGAIVGAKSGGDTQLMYWGGGPVYYGRSSLGGTVSGHEFRVGGATKLNVNSSGNTVASGTVTALGGELFLGTADSSSGHVNSYELMTFNIDSDNDDTNRYFGWYKNGNSGSGTSLMRLHEDGKLGIGTSPTTSLDVKNSGDSTYTGGLLIRTGTSTSEATSLYHDNNSATTSVLANRYNNSASAIKLILRASSSSPVTALTALGSGNVGIGTTSPAARLHVSDASDLYVDVDGTDSAIVFKEGGGNSWRIGNRASGDKFNISQDFGSLGTNVRFTIADGGNVGIGTTSPSAKLDVVANDNVYAAEFTQSNTSNGDGVRIQVGSTASADYALTVRSDAGSHSALAVKADGNVGIGVFAPDARLHVKSAGTGNVLYVESSDGQHLGGFYQESDTRAAFNVRDASGTVKVNLDAGGDSWFTGGEVGIGTSAPTAQLDVRRGDTSGKIAEFHQSTGYGIDIGSSQSVAYISSGYNQRLDFKTDPTSGQTNRMSILANGNVGIGTASPNYLLDIENSSGHAIARLLAGSNASASLRLQNDAQHWDVNLQTNDKFAVYDHTAGTQPFTIMPTTGNVGIGTTNPTQAKLNVGSSVSGKYLFMDDGSNGLFQFKATTSECIIEASTTGWAAWETLDLRANEFVFKPNNSERMRLTSTGLGIGTSSPSSLLHIQSNDSTTNSEVDMLTLTALSTGTTTTGFGPAIKFQAERNNGVMQGVGKIRSIAEVNSGTNISSGLAFETSTVGVLDEKMRITYDGNVGIGTTDPTSTLEIHSSVGTVPNSTNSSLALRDTTALAINNGASIVFSGIYSSSGGHLGSGPYIKAYKLNATSGDYSYGLQFGTRENGTGSQAVGLTITPDQLVGIGTSLPGMLLEVDASSGSANDIARFSGKNSAGLTLRNATANEFILHTATSDALVFGTNGNNERMRIDSSGNVGIGTSSPRRQMHIHNSASATVGFQLTNGATGESNDSQGFQLKVASDKHAELAQMENSDLRIFTNAQERMRIEASGNLLVGNTVVNPASGFATQRGFGYEASTGQVEIAATSDIAPLELGRNHADDGSIVVFRKQSVIVGSIGAFSGDLYIGTGDTTLKFEDGSDRIVPRGTDGAQRDGSISLGSTGNRFKDLYLSGAAKTDTISNEGSGTTTTSTTQTAIATFPHASYDSAKVIITANDGTDVYTTELLIVHNGTTASAAEYGQVGTGSALATYDVDINGTDVRVLATAAAATSTTFKVTKILL